jgi:phosphate transport system permease protein
MLGLDSGFNLNKANSMPPLKNLMPLPCHTIVIFPGEGASAMPESGANVQYERSAHLRLRLLKDHIACYGVAAGGLGVISSILLILLYLLFVVALLAEAREMNEVAVNALQSESLVIYLAMEEQAEIGAVFEQNGNVRFASTSDDALVQQVQLPIPKGVRIVSFSAARPIFGVVVLGLSNGQALVVSHRYKISYPNDQRGITPQLDYPLGVALVDVALDASALLKVAIQESAI